MYPLISMRIGIVILLLLAAAPATAESVLIEAARDTTLIQDPDDVAAELPRDAWVESVRLTLYMSPSNSASRRIDLHRALVDWGEGASFTSGGGGDFSAPGDATWIHTFYDDEFWGKPGGHFVARASASRDVAASGFYSWEGSLKMLADVRLWLAAPHRNFGWILLGDEMTRQNVKSFASRGEPDPSLRPVLEVIYHLPGE
jgi:hypothetical protein